MRAESKEQNECMPSQLCDGCSAKKCRSIDDTGDVSFARNASNVQFEKKKEPQRCICNLFETLPSGVEHRVSLHPLMHNNIVVLKNDGRLPVER